MIQARRVSEPAFVIGPILDDNGQLFDYSTLVTGPPHFELPCDFDLLVGSFCGEPTIRRKKIETPKEPLVETEDGYNFGLFCFYKSKQFG